jgi:hypothetical protein
MRAVRILTDLPVGDIEEAEGCTVSNVAAHR